MKFVKMHGCGNDYVYINCFDEKVENPKDLAIKMSDRHFGIGSDGLILILPSESADFRMRMFNADGSEAQMCGNGIRCVAKYIYDNHMSKNRRITLETLAGIKVLDMTVEDNQVKYVKVDMGEPILKAVDIPIISDKEIFINEPLTIKGQQLMFTGVSMGNPHAITFVEEVDEYDVKGYGEVVENHEIFPDRTNTEFVEVVNPMFLKMRVWERGSGETLACGTGACASLVAAVLNNKSERKATIKLLGGELIVEWNKDTNHVYMTGPAITVFEGIWKN